MKTFDQFSENFAREINRIDSNKPQQDIERRKRQERNDAAIKRVQDKTREARVGAEVRGPAVEREMLAKKKEQRKQAAAKQMAAAEAKASTVPQAAPAPAAKKPAARRPSSSADRSRADAARARQQKAREEKEAAARIKKRQGGLGGGIKSALGGDLRMDPNKAETETEREMIKDKNREKQAEFGKKKTQQVGKAAKSAAGFIKRAAQKEAEKRVDTADSGNVSGGSGYNSRSRTA